MKLHKSLLLFGTSLLLLTACGDDGGSTDDSSSDDPDTEDVVDEVDADEDEDTGEDEVVEEPSNEIVLGQPIEFDGFTVTITDLSVENDYDGNPMLVYYYDWVNTSEETASPFMTFDITGFQDGVSTETSPFSDTVDYGAGQVDVRPEGVVEGAQGAVGLTNIDAPVELELTESFSFSDVAYLLTVNPSDYQ